jgi:hypothetical protein
LLLLGVLAGTAFAAQDWRGGRNRNNNVAMVWRLLVVAVAVAVVVVEGAGNRRSAGSALWS